jgi:hypothetical protein
VELVSKLMLIGMVGFKEATVVDGKLVELLKLYIKSSFIL